MHALVTVAVTGKAQPSSVSGFYLLGFIAVCWASSEDTTPVIWHPSLDDPLYNPVELVDSDSYVSFDCNVTGDVSQISWRVIDDESEFTWSSLPAKWRETTEANGTVTLYSEADQGRNHDDSHTFVCVVESANMVFVSSRVLVVIPHLENIGPSNNSRDVWGVPGGHVILPCVDSERFKPHPSSLLQDLIDMWVVSKEPVSSTEQPDTDVDMEVSRDNRKLYVPGFLLISNLVEDDLSQSFLYSCASSYQLASARNKHAGVSLTMAPGSGPYSGQFYLRYRESQDANEVVDGQADVGLLLTSNRSIVARSGHKVTAFCAFAYGTSGYPLVQWEFQNEAGITQPPLYTGHLPQEYGDIQEKNGGAEIHFLATANLTGNFTCSAAGHSQRGSFTLKVLEKPQMKSSHKMHPRFLHSGETITLNCELTVPGGLTVWKKNGKPLESSPRIIMAGLLHTHLQLVAVVPADQGVYSCHVAHPWGHVHWSTAVYVTDNGPPADILTFIVVSFILIGCLLCLSLFFLILDCLSQRAAVQHKDDTDEDGSVENVLCVTDIKGPDASRTAYD